MDDLSVDDFESFFGQLWPDSHDAPTTPFPWQSELVRQVHDDRRWPDLVDLPTGSGKTSLLDLAVFLLALDASSLSEQRWMPRRIVLVVDRRVVVDQADERGAHIRSQLADAGDGVLRTVADRLRSLSGDGPALVTTVLRGGIVRDEHWAQRPDVPAIVSSTVDQVGSRLLFRGYGLSTGMRPIHAGLLANDVLLLLDEVHLARPFAETLDAVAGYRRWHDDQLHMVPDRWHVVQLSATPTGDAPRRFPAAPLDPDSHPVLSRRLLASKPARLQIVKVAKDTGKANEQLAAACVKSAKHQLRLDHVNTLGVIVNRVDTARHVARLLDDARGDVDVVLLTGRMRAIDRDRVLAVWGHRLRIGRDRLVGDRPLVVVATQSIEAGADFDLDSIVTECASLDALRQRFGRVDRDGRLGEARTPSSSTIVIRSTDVAATEPDPVYGHALTATWSWLAGLDHVDFGIEALAARLIDVDKNPLLPMPARAPRMLPGHLDQWVQTSHSAPRAEADVARWLHGLDRDEELAEVQIVWRADVDSSLLTEDAHKANRAELSARIAACPPVSSEALGVSIRELRRWAAGEGTDADASDTSGGRGTSVDSEAPFDDGHHYFFRWARGEVERVPLRAVRPGDTLVVPASTGGLWHDNWDPGSLGESVKDVALEAAARQRRRAVVRLSPALVTGQDLPDPALLQNETNGERINILRAWLLAEATRRDGLVASVLRHLGAGRVGDLRVRALVDRVVGGVATRTYVITSIAPLLSQVADLAPEDGDDAVSFTGAREVALTSHLHGVGSRARQFATNLGASDELVDDLDLAGRLHDLGKADSRFQRWLRPGQPAGTVLLAKSATPDVDRAARMAARELSGYPPDARHELLSLAMIGSAAPSSAHDPDLVRYLVASHHGFGRYRFSPCIDSAPEDVRVSVDGLDLAASTDHGLLRLDAGVPDLFWRLVRRYGWFGLTWIETILRLADHARSRAEQDGSVDDGDPT